MMDRQATPKYSLTDFDHILSIIQSESFQDIEGHWNSMLLEQCYGSDTPLKRSIHGLYALKHPQYGIIYIGKGKPIFRRIRSHYKATLKKGHEKAPAWRYFFELINSEITLYWFEVDHADLFLGEQYREALERLLQIKYKPLFDRLFSQLGYKEVEGFEERIKQYLSLITSPENQLVFSKPK